MFRCALFVAMIWRKHETYTNTDILWVVDLVRGYRCTYEGGDMTLTEIRDFLEDHMERNYINFTAVGRAAGYSHSLFRRFIREKRNIGIASLIDHLDALGFELVLRKKK